MVTENEHERRLIVLRKAAGAKIAQCIRIRGSDEQSQAGLACVGLRCVYKPCQLQLVGEVAAVIPSLRAFPYVAAFKKLVAFVSESVSL